MPEPVKKDRATHELTPEMLTEKVYELITACVSARQQEAANPARARSSWIDLAAQQTQTPMHGRLPFFLQVLGNLGPIDPAI